METRMEKVKEFVTENSEVIAKVSVSLIAGGITGCIGYKIGHKTGFKAGSADGIDEILYQIAASGSEGLVMINNKLGHYVFTAKKLSDK